MVWGFIGNGSTFQPYLYLIYIYKQIKFSIHGYFTHSVPFYRFYWYILHRDSDSELHIWYKGNSRLMKCRLMWFRLMHDEYFILHIELFGINFVKWGDF